MVDSIASPGEGTRRIATESASASVPVTMPASRNANQSVSATAQEKTEANEPASADARLKEALQAVDSKSQQLNRALRFSVHEGSGKTIIRVVDRETDEVIRQIPSEDFLKIAESLQDVGQGLIVESV